MGADGELSIMSRKKKKGKHKPQSGSYAEYRQGVRRADRVLAESGAEVSPDNWQALALDWYAPEEPERSTLARYIDEHEETLGVGWARDLLRLEIFYQAGDHLRAIDHFDRALARYPRCALVELWVADALFREAGDLWRARAMYRFAAEHLPQHPKPYYDLGFQNYLLGDFAGALASYDQAIQRVGDECTELAGRILHNRALMRIVVQDDRKGAIADVKEALRRFPDYAQARQTLRALRTRRFRWVPW